MYSGGIHKDLFCDMVKALPKDAQVIGMGEDLAYGTVHMFITSSTFKDINEGWKPSDIVAKFKHHMNPDHTLTPKFDGLDMSDAVDSSAACIHEWKEYHGAMRRFNYCVKCNEEEKP